MGKGGWYCKLNNPKNLIDSIEALNIVGLYYREENKYLDEKLIHENNEALMNQLQRERVLQEYEHIRANYCCYYF